MNVSTQREMEKRGMCKPRRLMMAEQEPGNNDDAGHTQQPSKHVFHR